jgi:hypothetical protein
MKKQTEKYNHESIYELVTELSQTKPDAKVLKALCEKTGLVYETDLVLLMSKVLVMVNAQPTNRKNLKPHFKTMIHEA